MNNEEKDPDEDSLPQEVREQQVWERLQSEAVAAQRSRLEQEMEQAREKSAADSGQDRSANPPRPNRIVVAGLASLIIITLLVAVVYVW